MREIAFRLLDTYRNTSKDAENIDIRHVVSFVESQRSRILQQRFTKPMYYINENLIQNLIAEEFQLIKSNNFALSVDGISIDVLGRDVLRSVRSIPKTIDRKNTPGTWIRISPSDMLNVRINVTNHERAITSGYSRFNFSEIYAFEYNGYIYVTSKNPAVLEPISRLDLRGVFESPLAVMRLLNPTMEDEELWDLEYPLSLDLVDDIENMIINEKLKISMESQTPEFPKE